MIRNIKDFLLECGLEELKQQRILNKQGGKSDKLVLNRHTVRPLIVLMKKKGIEKLEFPGFYGDEWYLDHNGNFKNPQSTDEKIKEGNINQLDQIGKVFDATNKIFNPYYKEAAATIKLPSENSYTPQIKKERIYYF